MRLANHDIRHTYLIVFPFSPTTRTICTPSHLTISPHHLSALMHENLWLGYRPEYEPPGCPLKAPALRRGAPAPPWDPSVSNRVRIQLAHNGMAGVVWRTAVIECLVSVPVFLRDILGRMAADKKPLPRLIRLLEACARLYDTWEQTQGRDPTPPAERATRPYGLYRSAPNEEFTTRNNDRLSAYLKATTALLFINRFLYSRDPAAILHFSPLPARHSRPVHPAYDPSWSPSKEEAELSYKSLRHIAAQVEEIVQRVREGGEQAMEIDLGATSSPPAGPASVSEHDIQEILQLSAQITVRGPVGNLLHMLLAMIGMLGPEALERAIDAEYQTALAAPRLKKKGKGKQKPVCIDIPFCSELTN